MKSDLTLWTGLLIAAAFVMFMAGLLAVIKPPSYSFWKLSIVVMEGGHYLVPPLVILGLWGLAGSPSARVAGFIALAAAGLFGTTYVRAVRMAGILEKEFEAKWTKGRINGTVNGRIDGRFDSAGGAKVNASRDWSRTSPISLKEMFTGVPISSDGFKTFVYKVDEGSAGADLKLDFYPAAGSAATMAAGAPPAGKPPSPRLAPCVIVIHGGGWDGGARSQLSPLNAFLAAEGYAVATLQYRLAPKHQYPAPVSDVADAMAWLRGHADALGIDSTRFAILGRSAGGQIALQAAYTSHDPAIKGVIAFYAPADMVFGYSLPTNPLIMDSRHLMVQYLGGAYPEVPGNYVASSPVEHLTSSCPPTLLLHGRPDVLVSWRHTVHMRAKMEELGVRHFIVDVPWGAHGFDFIFRGPGSQISLYFIERFLAEVLM